MREIATIITRVSPYIKLSLEKLARQHNRSLSAQIAYELKALVKEKMGVGEEEADKMIQSVSQEKKYEEKRKAVEEKKKVETMGLVVESEPAMGVTPSLIEPEVHYEKDEFTQVPVKLKPGDKVPHEVFRKQFGRVPKSQREFDEFKKTLAVE